MQTPDEQVVTIYQITDSAKIIHEAAFVSKSKIDPDRSLSPFLRRYFALACRGGFSVPKDVRRDGAKNAVTVRIEVGEDGEVYFAEAVAGREDLRWPAEEAALRAKFGRRLVEGKPVRVSGVLVYVIR